MNTAHTWRERRTQFLLRRAARKAARTRIETHFLSQPEPRTIGHFARGRQLIGGNFQFADTQLQAPNSAIWDIINEAPSVAPELHSFAWLDDLAAVGDIRARQKAQDWVTEWITRYGDGTGTGWTPALTGQRLIRWINHTDFLMRGQDKTATAAYFESLGQQTLFLGRTWRRTPMGLGRFQALAGIIIAGIVLDGLGEMTVPPAIKALAEDCATQIDTMGGVPTRNPEHLLEVFTLLTWAVQAMQATGLTPPRRIQDALQRIAPTLRALRHADGGLARFHSGGRGLEGRLDHALADSKVRVSRLDAKSLHMGFARISAGRTSVIIDAARPPVGEFSRDGHASTLAMEVTSGRRPIIVNCGSGRSFGDSWRRAGRATPSHSVLWLDGMSSSRLTNTAKTGTPNALMLDTPEVVQCEFTDLDDGKRVELSHDGYRKTHGLVHARVIDVAMDGRGIVGEDMLTTLSDNDTRRFNRHQTKHLHGIPYSIRFHLHPDVNAKVDLNGGAVSLILKSGEVWIFRHDGIAGLTLEPSVYLENGRLKPRASQQVVLSAAAIDYASRVRWSLAKAQDTPDAVRDLTPDEPVGGYKPISRGS